MPNYSTPGLGISVIDIRGTLTKYGSEFGPSMISLGWQVDAAAADPNVGVIVLRIDSGGGEVAGSFELAQAIANAAQVNTVIGSAEDMCASAAYLLLAQCSVSYASHRTTLVGSLGVVSAVLDTSAAFERAGLKMVRIRSGELKGSGLAGTELREAEIAQLQKLVTNAASEFILAVSRGRKLPPDQVRALATGAAFPAPEAVRLGLLDGIKTFSDVIGETKTPVMKLAADAQTYAARIETYKAAGFGEIDAEDKVDAAYPALAGAAKKFDALLPWQRDELSRFLKGRTL